MLVSPAGFSADVVLRVPRKKLVSISSGSLTGYMCTPVIITIIIMMVMVAVLI